MVKAIPACPACGLNDQVNKVSTLYIRGLEARKQQPPPGEGESVLQMEGLTPTRLHQLSRQLTPPSATRNRLARNLHPDLMTAGFSILLIFLLYQIWLTQRPVFWVFALAYLLFLGWYAWKRTALIAKYRRQVDATTADDKKIQRGIGRWMKLYYCTRDQGIFEPGNDRLFPLDEMQAYLLH
jgi:hypothetical protein